MFQGKTERMLLMIPVLIFFLLFGCAQQPFKKSDQYFFYKNSTLSSDIEKIQRHFPDIITQQIIGKTHEGREIYLVRITGSKPSKPKKPGMLAIFAEHSAEHDVTVLAVGLIKHLAENYGKNNKITNLLNETIVYIIPMMNPDGVEFDLSGEAKSFAWRKNRRPVGAGEYGVDLNRNWGLKWNISVSERLANDLNDKESPNYAGEEPFSENETKAVRDFILGHPNIKVVVDYHSGAGGFMQGMVIYPGPFFKQDKNLNLGYEKKYEEIAENFSKKISSQNDQRAEFIVNKNQNIELQMKKYFPWYIKPFIPNIPYPPGTSSEWIYGEMRIMSFGVEIQRDTDFFNNLKENSNRLINTHAKGFLFLLGVVSE